MRALAPVTRVLIVGGDSLIGSALGERLRSDGIHVTLTSRRKEENPNVMFMDLSQPRSFGTLESFDVAVLCAGVTSNLECSLDVELSRRVNLDGVTELAKLLSRNGAHVVFISSSLVFDGSVQFVSFDTAVNPQCEYGRQKADAEKAIRESCNDVAIVRLSKVVSSKSSLFKGWLESLGASRSIEAFSDVKFSPISLPFAIEVLFEILKTRAPGFFQASARDEISYADAGRILASKLGASEDLIHPILGRKLNISFFPRHTTLAPFGLDRLNMSPKDSAAALEYVLAESKLNNTT